MKTKRRLISLLSTSLPCLRICAFQSSLYSLLNSPTRHQGMPPLYSSSLDYDGQDAVLFSATSGSVNHLAVDASNQEKNERNIANTDDSSQAAYKMSPSIKWGKKVLNGARVAPILFAVPFYSIGFGILGHKYMWAFSEWISVFTKPSERWLFDHFDQMQKLIASGTAIASSKASGYRIHPAFAGLSLITTPILAFVKPSEYKSVISRKGLLVANFCICFISSLSGKTLISTMLGDAHAKKWNYIQGNLCIALAALSVCPGRLGSICAHLNWSLLFCVGVLERCYVLCVLSQFHLQNRKKYMESYSPMMKVAPLGSIPLALATYFLFGSNII